MKSEKKLLSTLIITGFLLAGCGGGSGGGDDPDTDLEDDPTNGNAGGDGGTGAGGLIVQPTCNLGPIKFPDGSSFSAQFGSDGDLRANCLSVTSNPQGAHVMLADGIPSMNVVNVERTMEFDETCSDGEITDITHSSNYQTGTITLSGSANGKSLSCTEKYDLPLPATIGTSESIHDLIFEWGATDEDNGLISSSCPDEEEEIDDAVTCTGSTLYNIIVTDDQGNKHRVAGKIEFTDL